MEKISRIRDKVDMLEEEIGEVKKVLIAMHPASSKQNRKSWKELVKASKEISKRWKGKSAVGEIREQRTK